jgi:hypothetical protein
MNAHELPHGWQPIGAAPTDGTTLFLRRLYQGRLVWQGRGFHGFMAADALPPLGRDPLNRMSEADYAAEEAERQALKSTSGWITADGMHCAPMPTHWWNGDDEPPPP